MAYEAYNATTTHIAQQVYAAWGTGEDHNATMAKLCREANVETHHVNHKLTQLIHDGHLNRCLVRTDN